MNIEILNDWKWREDFLLLRESENIVRFVLEYLIAVCVQKQGRKGNYSKGKVAYSSLNGTYQLATVFQSRSLFEAM